MRLVDKHLLRALHKPGWAGFWLTHLYFAVFFVLVYGLHLAVEGSSYVLLVPLVLAQAFVMHALLIAFHEAAHGGLCPYRGLNGYLGRVIGVPGWMSLSLYRAAHHWHHAYLGDRRDEEFWPLNDPTASRSKRRLAAFLELVCGLGWTPFLFLRMFLRRGTAIRNHGIRRVIWVELIGLGLFWAATFGLVVWFDVMTMFVVAYLIPAVIAGNMQSLRKYVEHVGLTGRGLALTRSVRNPSLVGRVISWLLFQEPFHDVHHLYPKVPQVALPLVAAAENPVPPELPVFPNYTTALLDLLRGLADPKFGKAWAEAPALPVPEPVHALSDSA
jgi:fatty acid desaturase